MMYKVRSNFSKFDEFSFNIVGEHHREAFILQFAASDLSAQRRHSRIFLSYLGNPLLFSSNYKCFS